MSGETDRMRLKDKIISNIAKAIKAIQQYQLVHCPDETTLTLSNGDWQCHKLCENLDHALLHGLRHSSSSYWAVVKEFTHKEAVKEIQRLQNIATDLGRARAWLFMSLNESLLESYMRCLADSEKFLKKHYAKEALVLDQQRMNVLVTLTSGLDFVCFQLEYDVPYLDLSTMPPRGHACPEPLLPRPVEDDRRSVQSYDSLHCRTPNSMEVSMTTSESPRGVLDSDTASVASGDGVGGGVGVGGQVAALRQCSLSLDSGCPGDAMVSSTSSSSSKRQSVADTVSVSSLETDTKDSRIQRIESITSDIVPDGTEDGAGLEVIRIKSKTSGKLRKKKRRGARQEETSQTSKVPDKTRNGLVVMPGERRSQEGEALSLTEDGTTSGPVPDRRQSSRQAWLQSAHSSSPTPDSNGRPEFPVGSLDSDGSSLHDAAELRKMSVTPQGETSGQPYGNSLGRRQSEDCGASAAEGRDRGDVHEHCKEADGQTGDVALEGKVVEAGSLRQDVADSTLKMQMMVDAMQGNSTTETTDSRSRGQSPRNGPSSLPKSGNVVRNPGARVKGKEEEEEDFYSQSFQERLSPSQRPIVSTELDDYVDFITETKSSSSSPAADAVDAAESPSEARHETEPAAPATADKSIDVSEGNLKLQLILHVFQEDDENLIKMFATRMGHTEGDLRTVFVLITDSFLYLTRQKESDKIFVKEASIAFSELDYVTLGMNEQTINIVCTNRRRQFLLTTGDVTLTRAIVECLQTAVSTNSGPQKLPVLSDSSTQAICLKKSAARDCKCQISEVEIADYSLVYWEDPRSGSNNNSASKEGTLLLRLPDAFRGPSWRPVHVTLRDQILCIFENNEATKPERFVRLGSEQCAGCRLVAVDNREFCIEVILSDGNSWELSAASNSEVTAWQQKLCQAVSEGTQQGMNNWPCLPCSVLVTGAQLLMYHEDSQTQFHRLLGAANIHDITALASDPQTPSFIILEFESQEAGVSSEQWVLYFNDQAERSRFITALSKCWSRVFQVELPLVPLEDLPLQEHCCHTGHRLEESLQVKR